MAARRGHSSFGLRHSFVIRYSSFVILPSHLFRHFDSEKIETALQNSPGEIAQCKPRTARRLFRFQDRARFVECVEAVGQLEQVVRQNVRTKIIQHLRDDFRKKT